jgi:hypothetical protein
MAMAKPNPDKNVLSRVCAPLCLPRHLPMSAITIPAATGVTTKLIPRQRAWWIKDSGNTRSDNAPTSRRATRNSRKRAADVANESDQQLAPVPPVPVQHLPPRPTAGRPRLEAGRALRPGIRFTSPRYFRSDVEAKVWPLHSNASTAPAQRRAAWRDACVLSARGVTRECAR